VPAALPRPGRNSARIVKILEQAVEDLSRLDEPESSVYASLHLAIGVKRGFRRRAGPDIPDGRFLPTYKILTLNKYLHGRDTWALQTYSRPTRESSRFSGGLPLLRNILLPRKSWYRKAIAPPLSRTTVPSVTTSMTMRVASTWRV